MAWGEESQAAPTHSRHGPWWDASLLDELAPPVGTENGLLVRQAAVSIAAGHLPEGVPDDAIRLQAQSHQHIYKGNLGAQATPARG